MDTYKNFNPKVHGIDKPRSGDFSIMQTLVKDLREEQKQSSELRKVAANILRPFHWLGEQLAKAQYPDDDRENKGFAEAVLSKTDDHVIHSLKQVVLRYHRIPAGPLRNVEHAIQYLREFSPEETWPHLTGPHLETLRNFAINAEHTISKMYSSQHETMNLYLYWEPQYRKYNSRFPKFKIDPSRSKGLSMVDEFSDQIWDDIDLIKRLVRFFGGFLPGIPSGSALLPSRF